MPRAAGAAAAIKEELGLEATLVRGDRGVFEVCIDERVVARKTLDGFPSEDEVVAAVRRAMDEE